MPAEAAGRLDSYVIKLLTWNSEQFTHMEPSEQITQLERCDHFTHLEPNALQLYPALLHISYLFLQACSSYYALQSAVSAEQKACLVLACQLRLHQSDRLLVSLAAAQVEVASRVTFGKFVLDSKSNLDRAFTYRTQFNK